jgi:hypothetical protein
MGKRKGDLIIIGITRVVMLPFQYLLLYPRDFLLY